VLRIGHTRPEQLLTSLVQTSVFQFLPQVDIESFTVRSGVCVVSVLVSVSGIMIVFVCHVNNDVVVIPCPSSLNKADCSPRVPTAIRDALI